jgi:hypothetical protein
MVTVKQLKNIDNFVSIQTFNIPALHNETLPSILTNTTKGCKRRFFSFPSAIIERTRKEVYFKKYS